jgi:hypothetical protein
LDTLGSYATSPLNSLIKKKNKLFKIKICGPHHEKLFVFPGGGEFFKLLLLLPSLLLFTTTITIIIITIIITITITIKTEKLKTSNLKVILG